MLRSRQFSFAKTLTTLQDKQRKLSGSHTKEKPSSFISILRLSFTWSLVSLAQNSVENNTN